MVHLNKIYKLNSMNRITALLLTLTFFSFSNINAQYTDVINSNRPGKSMSAFSVGKTVIQAELGVYGVNEKHKYLEYQTKGIGTDLSLRYGAFLEQLEFVVDLQYQNDNYIRFDESDAFQERFNELVAQKKHIYMATDPNYFSNKRDITSRLTQTLQNQGLLDNYYYFFHDIENLNGFYTKFEDFLLYMLNFLNLKKYGLTFLAQPHSTFESPQIKLLFTFLYLGRCSNLDYFNTSNLKKLPKNRFFYQYRTNYQTLLFNDIKSNIVQIDEYLFEE